MAAAITLFSCKKTDENVGLITPDQNLDLLVLDTFTILTSTVEEDSLFVSQLTARLLGSVYHPEFGTSRASIVTEFRIPQVNFNFGPGAELDSIVLTLRYRDSGSFNGNPQANQLIKVYDLNERLYIDSNYFSNRVFQRSFTAVGEYNGRFNTYDSITLIEKGLPVKYPAHLRIRLDNNTIGQRFINASTTDFSSNENFLNNILKGLYIDAEQVGTVDGIVAQFLMTSVYSGITVYYNDTSKAVFPILNTCAFSSIYDNDFSGTPIASQIADPNSNYNTTFLQSKAGAKTKITIPNLLSLVSGETRYAVVSAKFTFKVDPSSITSGFNPPERLNLFAIDSLGRSQAVIDLFQEPALYGGSYNSTNQTYTFNIARHMQAILKEFTENESNVNRGLYLLMPTDRPLTGSRLKMDMSKGNGIKFELSLIKIN